MLFRLTALLNDGRNFQEKTENQESENKVEGWNVQIQFYNHVGWICLFFLSQI